MRLYFFVLFQFSLALNDASAATLTLSDEEQILLFEAGRVISRDHKWPHANGLAFKGIVVGAPFSLSKDDAWVVLPKDSHTTMAPFRCEPASAFVPIFDCATHNWVGVGVPIPASFQDTDRAFGEPVVTHFWVVPDAPPTLAQFKARDFGPGRIMAIYVERDTPSQAFLDAAHRHFTSTFGTEPVVRSTYKQGVDVHSAECARELSRIGRKTLGDLTLDDRTMIKRCELEATSKFLSGNAITSRTVVSEWLSADGAQRAALKLVESSIDVPGVGRMARPSEAQIALQAYDPTTMGKFMAEFSNTLDAVEQKRRTTTLQDF